MCRETSEILASSVAGSQVSFQRSVVLVPHHLPAKVIFRDLDGGRVIDVRTHDFEVALRHW